MAFGVVVRFDETKGYGFIAPDDGGNDVFVHTNELTERGAPIGCGTRVQFRVVDSGRGLKAFGVRVVEEVVDADEGREDAGCGSGQGDCSVAEFTRVATELLLRKAPDLSARQVLEVRAVFVELACARGWVGGGD